MGARSLPHGRPAAHRCGVRVHGRSGPATPGVGSGSAGRDCKRGRHRRAGGALEQQSSGEAGQRRQHPSPARALGAAALRVPERRRGGQAQGAGGARRRGHGPGRAHRPARAAPRVRVTLELQAFLLVWGTLVGLDLVSVPQMMIARPIVAGSVAGAILGDLATGLQLGVLFELFQYDVMPMGAVRYPEYGPATVAAVSTAHAAAGTLGLGLGALVGLVTGMLGGMSMSVVRRATARAVQAVAGRLEAGDAHLLVRLHVTAIARDALRAAAVTTAGLGLAQVVRVYFAGTLPLRGVALLGVAGGAAAVAGRGAGRARGRDARSGGAAAQRVVRSARVARRPARVGRVVAGDVGPRLDRRGAGARDGRDSGLPGGVQRRPRRAPVVGAAGGLGTRRARRGCAAPAVPAAGRGVERPGDGARGGRRAAAVHRLPGRGVHRMGAGAAVRGRGGRLRAPVVGARETHGTALRPGAARRRRTGGLGMAVIEREAKIVNPLGMHARPAAEFVKVANRFKSAVQVRKDDLAVNGKSIMGVMMLAAECGSSLFIKTDGEDADAAMEALLA